jgi:hypothetical protein
MRNKRGKETKRKRSFPNKDADFHVFQELVMKKTRENWKEWKLSRRFVFKVLTPLQAAWAAAWAACQDEHSVTMDMRIRKTAAREAYEKELRVHVGGLQHNPCVLEAALKEMNIATDKGGGHRYKAVVGTQPQMGFDTSMGGQVTINLWEKGSESKGMPEHARTAEVRWTFSEEIPVDISGFEHVMTVYHTLTVFEYPLSDRGRAVYFICRWVSAAGERGVWSEVYRVVLG